MPAYIVVDIAIHDPNTYARYKDLAPPSIAKYGGRYVVRGGSTKALEGSWTPERFVILEFADEPRAVAFERYLKSGAGCAFAARHFR